MRSVRVVWRLFGWLLLAFVAGSEFEAAAFDAGGCVFDPCMDDSLDTRNVKVEVLRGEWERYLDDCYRIDPVNGRLTAHRIFPQLRRAQPIPLASTNVDFIGAKGIASSSEGAVIHVALASGNRIVSFARNLETGELTLREIDRLPTAEAVDQQIAFNRLQWREGRSIREVLLSKREQGQRPEK